ncbi:MAG TPA: hypothetical protein DEP42_03675 [Ruminococcaceae bacterium]|nr:hypothetical protein [Oscillospiraceae bacterium]
MRLFPKKAYAACRHCTHGKLASEESRVLCRNKGIVDADYVCRKYRYDPLKRIPHRRPTLPDFSPDDFKL